MNKMAPFTQRQLEYLKRCLSAWFNVAEGGKRGGKNVLQTMAYCICLDEHPNKIHLIAGVSTATARLNILDCDGFGLLNYFEGRCRAGLYQNRDCLYINSRTGEKVVLVSGGGKSGDEKLIKGNTYGMAYITEANECAKVFIQEVFDRTLSSKDRKVFHDLNPKGDGHWYYGDILDFHEERQRDDAAYGYNYGHFTIADNMSVTDGELKTRIATYDKRSVWYQRDILGKRKQAEGLIYPMFDRLAHIFKDADAPQSGEWYVSIDYGVQNPFAALLWRVSGNVAYCMAEYYHDGRKGGQRTDEEHADAVIALAGKRFIEKYVIDPSASSFIQTMMRRGKPMLHANNEVVPGIAQTATALSRGRLRFHESCVNTVREFGLYSWDEKAKEDKPVKENDHCMDSVRYFVRTLLRRELPVIERGKDGY